MSLLSDIQAECTAESASISRLLRLCLQLSARLRHAPLKEWVQHELNGYPSEALLPEYRLFNTRSQGFFADRLVGQATLDIPLRVLPEEFRDRFSKARFGGPISQYEELLRGGSDDEFRLPWPADLARIYGSKISPLQCINAWQVIPRATFVGLIDTVKTRVLSMVLDIEAENPTAGDIPSSSFPIAEQKVAQIFNTNIYGGQVQNLAAGSSGVVQNVVNQVAPGDREALLQALRSVNIPEEQLRAIVEVLDEDKREGVVGIGGRVGRWLASLGKAAGEGGGQVAVAVATQALLAYFGLGA